MLELAKLIHEAIGIESPRKFIVVFAVLGTVLFASLGWLIDKGYRTKVREDARESARPSLQVTGPADAGNGGGVANTGNGNTINQSPPPQKPRKKE